jgi:dTDP-4-amino-4,6-dideoxygalactose transaminase
MKIQLIDLKQRYQEEKKELIDCFKKVVKNGSLVLTDEVQNFENKICKYIGTKYCLGLNSGTDALMMGLWALGVKKGDEVITSPVSFIASAGAIYHLGAKPVFVDVSDDLNINPELIEKAITKRTKAIMPVHWSGKICQMDKIIKISKKYKLPIIEDSAQGMGSYFNNIHAGNFGDVAAFSAHPLKNLNALGDSGFITTNNKKIYEKIKLYRNHGIKSRDNVVMFGVNSRLDSLHAEILSYRLKNLKKIILKRRQNINLYSKYIATNKVVLPKDNYNTHDSYVMMISKCTNRNKLQKFLEQKGIQSLIYYGTPLHLHKASKKLGYKKGDFPNAEKLCGKVLSFPHHQYLSKKQIIYISKKINEFYEN